MQAAREGLGDDGILLVDAGTIWNDDVERALQTLPFLEAARATWLEEPFVSGALDAYAQLSKHCRNVKLAGGEGCHDYWMAKSMIDRARVGFIQIDTGRIGGISPAYQVAKYAQSQGVQYVNHSFTSHLAVSASLQPYAGIEAYEIGEFPVEPKPLALAITREHFALDSNGQISVPDAPGLGLSIDTQSLQKYLVEVEIKVAGEVLYCTPEL